MGPGRAPGAILDRDAELAVIAAAIDSAMSGSGSTVLVEGVAGIGKTRLMTHACALGTRAGLRVLTARGPSSRPASPGGSSGNSSSPP